MGQQKRARHKWRPSLGAHLLTRDEARRIAANIAKLSLGG
jgi:hypothetical protein